VHDRYRETPTQAGEAGKEGSTKPDEVDEAGCRAQAGGGSVMKEDPCTLPASLATGSRIPHWCPICHERLTYTITCDVCREQRSGAGYAHAMQPREQPLRNVGFADCADRDRLAAVKRFRAHLAATKGERDPLTPEPAAHPPVIKRGGGRDESLVEALDRVAANGQRSRIEREPLTSITLTALALSAPAWIWWAQDDLMRRHMHIPPTWLQWTPTAIVVLFGWIPAIAAWWGRRKPSITSEMNHDPRD
jgi:hypothetical protein